MKNKGFTLVELLGVIVVLAIIALIAVPTILEIIDKSRKGALQNSGYGLVEAGNLYNAQYQNEQTARFDIKDSEVTTEEVNKLTYKGNIKEGTVLVNNNGEVTVCINDGKYAAYKNFKDNKVIVVNNKNCNIPENSNIVYLDNEATVDINIEDLVKEIETLKNEVASLKEGKSNQVDVTNFMNNIITTHNSDIALLNTITSNHESILNQPVSEETATLNMAGGFDNNVLRKNGFLANIELWIHLDKSTSSSDVIATVPTNFAPSYNVYLMGMGRSNQTWVPLLFVLRKNGEIFQNFNNIPYDGFIILGTYPVC